QLIDNQSTGALSLIGVTLQQDAVTFSTATLADNFAIEDRVEHAVDTAGLGLVTWVVGNLYVTAASGSIQNGIDAAAATNVIHVHAGTYNEKLVINKALDLSGPQVGATGVGRTAVPEALLQATSGAIAD